jgi:hypothetical protein
MITTSLAKAVEQASERSAEEQAIIAEMILEELDSERKWEDLLLGSKDKLAALANRSLADLPADKTIPHPNSKG